MFITYRTLETTQNPDGSATTHALVRCTLTNISQATSLRIEDVAFALNECGLLVRRRRVSQPSKWKSKEEPEKDGEGDGDEEVKVKEEKEHKDEDELCITISREMVEAVAQERRVKRMCLDLAHVLL